MESKWSKARKALGLRLRMGICIAQPLTAEDAVESASSSAVVTPPAPAPCRSAPTSPHLPSPLRLVRSATRSSRRMCAICLETMRAGHGHALFTAECSHTFHFHCIASNVKHGNRVCPVCRAKWSEVPLQGPPIRGRTRINPVAESADAWPWPFLFPAATLTHRLPPPRPPLPAEPATFDDDEPVAPPPAPAPNRSKHLQLNIVPDFPEVPRAEARDDFTVLVHVKAPSGAEGDSSRERAPIDLVTVLDVSGSMAGTKLALLKRAMSFVIHNLGPADRLSVVAFSSSARRLFPLSRMSEAGRQVALQAVNGLASSGGTNIAQGLRKATQVLQQRRHRNPVCSVILLSDGQDTYNVTSRRVPDYQSLLPANSGSNGSEPASARIPIHTFGFGADHDSSSMHSISEASGGTFSFIETEGMIQDAFAQCIGGLLSVVVQDMRVTLASASASASPPVPVGSVQAGSYSATVAENGRTGVVHIGDLYAEEERDFLVHVRLPAVGEEDNDDETPVLQAASSYRDPVSREEIRTSPTTLSVRRPDSSATGDAGLGSLEVDRQRNRLCTAESIAEARALADRGDLTAAQAVLGDRRRALQASLAAQLGDQLCASLDAELKQIQERMATRQLYETSGRAYALSGLSSHSWQRVTTRGDNTDSSTSLVYGYQTPSMIDMLMRSQTISSSVNNNNNNNNNNSARTRTLLPSRSMPLTESRSSSH